MKRSSAYLTLLALAMVLVLSSCAFLQKGEFAQRKYYNFPRTNHSDVQTASVESKTTETTPISATEPQDVKKSEPVVSASAKNKTTIAQKTEMKVVKNNSVRKHAQVTAVESTSVSLKKSDIRRETKKKSHVQPRVDGGTYMFLAVIAAIFFPPLGVYIKDHHTNKWFWITLLLCLAGGGLYLFYIGTFGLLYLAAIVLALMDVFDLLG